jgi:hypothetical protein
LDWASPSTLDSIITEAICVFFVIFSDHKSIQMTARYSRATSERIRNALEKLAATLSQPANIPSADDPANRSAWRNINRKHG